VAWLDPSEILLDPEFASTFVVIQRPETITASGRSEQNPVAVPNVIGVVTAATPNELVRLEDMTHGRRTIKIYTRFRLQAASVGRQPDLVVWRGDSYVVITFDPYANFGAGWIKAFATSIDATDAVVQP
jgi:hypothetical protein